METAPRPTLNPMLFRAMDSLFVNRGRFDGCCRLEKRFGLPIDHQCRYWPAGIRAKVASARYGGAGKFALTI
jgi:hypothetical protein